MRKIYPFDLTTARQLGIAEWMEEHFDMWPVTIDEFGEIISTIHTIYCSYILDKGRQNADLLLAAYKLVYEYTILSVHAIAFDRLNKQSYDINFNQDTPYVNFVSDNTNEIKTFSYGGKLIPVVPTVVDKATQKLRNYYRFNVRQIAGLLSKGENGWWPCLYPPTDKLLAFAENHNKRIKVVYPYNLKDGARTYVPSDYTDLVKSIMVEIVQVINRFGTGISVVSQERLEEWTLNLLGEIDFNIHAMSEFFRRVDSPYVLTPVLGNIYSRCACIAAKRNGKKIVGHAHGNEFGLTQSDTWGNVVLSLTDEFVVENKQSRLLWSLYAKNHALVDDSHIQFPIVKTSQDWKRLNIHKGVRRTQSSPASRSVMVYEHDMRHHSPVLGPHTYWQYQLGFLLRVANDLKSNGFKTILKRSPASLQETESLYEEYFDKIIDEPFEECMYEADVILFIYAGSTGFTISLFTDLPIVTFEHELNYYHETVQDDLRGRVKIVKTAFVGNRISYDAIELVEAVNSKPGSQALEFVNKYYASL